MASSSAFGSCLTSCLRSSKALSTRRSTGPWQRGWISSKWGVTETGRRAKFYTLTKVGGKQLTAEEASWDPLALAIAKVRKSSLRRLMMEWFNMREPLVIKFDILQYAKPAHRKAHSQLR